MDIIVKYPRYGIYYEEDLYSKNGTKCIKATDDRILSSLCGEYGRYISVDTYNEKSKLYPNL